MVRRFVEQAPSHMTRNFEFMWAMLGLMPLEWVSIAASVTAYLKTYASERASKISQRVGDDLTARAYNAMFTSGTPAKANEAFVTRFGKELDSAIDLPTVLLAPYRDALQVFLYNSTVQDLILAPLDGQSELDWELLRGIWRGIQTGELGAFAELPAEFDWCRLAKTYRQSIQRLALADSKLRPLLEAVSAIRTAETGKLTSDAVQRLPGVPKDFDINRYAQALKGAHTCLRLGALDADWPHYENRIRLENVYIPQTVKNALPGNDQARDYLFERSRHRDMDDVYENAAAIPLPQVLADSRYKRIIVLGNPGLGKSTLLKKLALDWAERPRDPIVLYIELRRSSRESGYTTFLDYLETGPDRTCCLRKMDLHDYLKQKGGLILFDGLDEVGPAARGDTVSDVIRFAEDYPECRLIVTTRVLGYYPGSTHPEQFRDAGFEQFTLQEFGDAEVEKFIGFWHKEAFGDIVERGRFELRLRTAIERSPSIRELAGNPLLLTMMAILNRTQNLPRDRAKLYERCAELLLRDWDLEKFPELKDRRRAIAVLDKVGSDQKMRILEEVAVAMHDEPGGLSANLIPEEKLRIILERYLTILGITEVWSVANDLLWMLRERNFMLAHFGDRQYGFIHRTYLEFFFARSLRSQLERTFTLSIDGLRGIVRQKWSAAEWHEPLRLLCGLIAADSAGKCVSELLIQGESQEAYDAVLLAAQCLREVYEVGIVSEVRTRVLGAVLALTRYDLAYYSDFYDDKEPIWEIRSRAVQELARGWKDDLKTLDFLRSTAGQDRYAVVRSNAVREIAVGWKDAPETLVWLRERARRNDDGVGVLRGAAVRELIRGWMDDSDVRSIVNEYVARETHSNMWKEVIDTLGARGFLDREHLRLAIIRAADRSKSMRRVVAHTLGTWWHHEGDTLKMLLGLALDDKDVDVRCAAIAELGESWRGDGGVATKLRDCLRDEERAVRRSALLALASNKYDSEIVNIARSTLVSDPDETVRRAALVVLIVESYDKSEANSVLREQAINAPDENTRAVALALITLTASEGRETTEFLQQKATTDPSEAVRQAAVSHLAERQSREPRLSEWLKQRLTDEDSSVVKAAIARSLAKSIPEDRDLIDWLVMNIGQTDNPAFACDALDILAPISATNQEVFELIGNVLEERKEADIREAAVNALSRYCRGHKGTREVLLGLSQNEAEPAVRIAALRAISAGWHNDAEVFGSIAYAAVCDIDDVRIAAVIELKESWSTFPGAYTVLVERANIDKRPECRSQALWGLQWSWLEHPEARAFLRHCALSDADSDVRRSALAVLGRGWDDDPETLSTVMTMVVSDRDAERREHALQHLTINTVPSAEVLAILRNVASHDPETSVRAAAEDELKRLAVTWSP